MKAARPHDFRPGPAAHTPRGSCTLCVHKPGVRAVWSLARCAIAAIALVAAVGHGSQAVAEDWPRWRGPRADGTWHAPELPERWPAEGLAIRWRVPLGGGYAGVVAVADRVYTMDRQTAPDEVERVVAFDTETGRVAWSHEYPVRYDTLDYGNGPRAAPTIHDGRVYSFGALGHCRCLDAATGRLIWSHDFTEAQGRRLQEWGLAASPVVWGDLVIVHPGLEPAGCYVALDRRTGAEVWRSGNDPAGYATPIVVQHAGEPLLVAWTPLHVLGMSPTTGEIYWSFDYEVTYGVSIATPIYEDGLVVVSGYWEGSKAIRLGATPRHAQLAWEENRYLRGLMSQALVRDGYGYLLDKHHGLICFELATGRKLWDDGNRLTRRDRNPQATLVWTGADDRILALNAEGELVLARINPQGYTELSRSSLLGPTWAHPAYAGRMVFARSDEELVAAWLSNP